eukprot:scaffold6.g2788.t1
MEVLSAVPALRSQALPLELLALIQEDAQAISQAPNYWVPRGDVEHICEGGTGCARTTVEAAVAHLFASVARPALAARGALGRWAGAEDEFAMKERGELVTPILGSVLYLTGDAADAGSSRQSATAIVDQTFDAEAGCSAPPNPTQTLLVFPQAGAGARANQYCVFDGGLAHGVLDALAAPRGDACAAAAAACGSIPGGARATLLVNWWAAQPQGVECLLDADVASMRLSPPPAVALAAASGSPEQATTRAPDDTTSNGSQPGSSGSGPGKAAAAAVPVAQMTVDAEGLGEEGMLMVDDLLQQRGVALTGPDAVHAVLIRHRGLSLCPVDVEGLLEQGDQAPTLHVAAALVPLDVWGSESESEGESESEEGSRTASPRLLGSPTAMAEMKPASPSPNPLLRELDTHKTRAKSEPTSLHAWQAVLFGRHSIGGGADGAGGAHAHAQPAAVITASSLVMTADETYTFTAQTASHKYSYPLPKLVVLGILAGAYIGLGYSLCCLVGGLLSPEFRAAQPGVFNLLFGIYGFPMGLTLCVVAGGDLFTSNCMYATTGWWEGRFGLLGWLRMLLVSYFSNLVGALLLVGLMVGADVFYGTRGAFVLELAHKKARWCCAVQGSC